MSDRSDDPMREMLIEWAESFLSGLSFNEPALKRADWAKRRAPDVADSILATLPSTPETSLDRFRAIEYEAEAWHDAIRRGDFGPGTCACNRADSTRCSLGAALEGAPHE